MDVRQEEQVLSVGRIARVIHLKLDEKINKIK